MAEATIGAAAGHQHGRSLAGCHFGNVIRRLWTMMLGIFVGMFATAGILTGGSSDIAALALGVTLIFYAVPWWRRFLVAVASAS